MSRRPRLRVLATGLAVMSVFAIAGRVRAEATHTLDELQRKVERVAPRLYTLPGKVFCSCPAPSGSNLRPVGYLNHTVSDHGLNRAVDVMCAYTAFTASGDVAFISASGDYRLLK